MVVVALSAEVVHRGLRLGWLRGAFPLRVRLLGAGPFSAAERHAGVLVRVDAFAEVDCVSV